jgi:hypothetical protein
MKSDIELKKDQMIDPIMDINYYSAQPVDSELMALVGKLPHQDILFLFPDYNLRNLGL